MQKQSYKSPESIVAFHNMQGYQDDSSNLQKVSDQRLMSNDQEFRGSAPDYQSID